MVPIVIANFAENGQDTLQIFIQIAVISQMAAAFGVFLKAKDKELKTNALSSGITGIFGITEPAIYGITLLRKGAYPEDGKGLSIQDIMPRGIKGAPTEVPTEDNMKLIAVDFYHRYKEDIAMFAEMDLRYFVFLSHGQGFFQMGMILSQMKRDFSFMTMFWMNVKNMGSSR